jgi:hypothetical protein
LINPCLPFRRTHRARSAAAEPKREGWGSVFFQAGLWRGVWVPTAQLVQRQLVWVRGSARSVPCVLMQGQPGLGWNE